VDLGWAPKKPCRRITPQQRQKAIKLKEDLTSWGAERIKRDYGLWKVSEKSLRRIWREEGLLKRKKH